jgi:hypothetical protein
MHTLLAGNFCYLVLRRERIKREMEKIVYEVKLQLNRYKEPKINLKEK